jgi:simple sugar transport system ATP-binding protein
MGENPAAASAAAVPRVRLQGIRKQFGSIQALRGVDLDLMPGEVLGLVGDNAAGKSTLTKVISGAYLPDQGRILVDGSEATYRTPAEARAMGIEMVYQDLSLCDTVDVAGNLFLGREPRRSFFGMKLLDKKRMREEARRHLDALDIHVPSLDAYVEKLSGGQRQSIAIARALAGRPQIVIFDEPSSAMDNQTEGALIKRLDEELKGRTFVLITHRPPLLALVQRIILLDRGRIIADGPRDEVLKQIARPKAA